MATLWRSPPESVVTRFPILPDSQSAERGDEVVHLEHEADGLPPEGSEVLLAGEIYPVDDDAAFVGDVERAYHVEQGRLAGARGPCQRDEIAVFHLQADPVERPDVSIVKVLSDISQLYYRCHLSASYSCLRASMGENRAARKAG
jgi:hypothetical protein